MLVRSGVRVVILLILAVGAFVGVSLLRAGGGGGAAMIVFAILAVTFFASLPVLTGRFAARSAGQNDPGHDQRVVRMDGPDADGKP